MPGGLPKPLEGPLGYGGLVFHEGLPMVLQRISARYMETVAT